MAPGWTRFGWYEVVSIALMTLPSVGCGSDPVAPEDELTMSMTSAHFVYRWSAGDQAPDSTFQERHLAWVTARLGLTPGAPLEYRKYRDKAHLRRVTGHTLGTGFAEPGTYRFHTIWPADNHEYVHSLVTTLVGTPPALFNEGVAVAHHGASLSGSFEGDPLWNGGSVHARVRSLRVTHQLPDLDDVIEDKAFWKIDSDVTYAVAGSFVRYLIDEGGADRFLQLVARCPRDGSASQIRGHFHDVYGDDFDSWWARWLSWL